MTATHLTYPLTVHEIEEGTVFEDEQFIVTAASVIHGVEAFGYRVQEKDIPGALQAGRLKEMNIPPGITSIRKSKKAKRSHLTMAESLTGGIFWNSRKRKNRRFFRGYEGIRAGNGAGAQCGCACS